MGQIQKVSPTSTNKPLRNPGPFSDMDLQHEADRLLEGSMAVNTLKKKPEPPIVSEPALSV
jgi:hypothetical protein